MIHCLMFWGLFSEILILGLCNAITDILTIVMTLVLSSVLPLYITMPALV
jgi:hypothetical protein